MLWKISSSSKGSFLVCMCWFENKCVFESNFDSLMVLLFFPEVFIYNRLMSVLGNDLGYWCSRNLFMLKSRQWSQWDCVFGPSSCELSRSWNISFSTREMTPPSLLTGKRAWWDSFGFPQWKPVPTLSLEAWGAEQQHEGRRGVLWVQPVWGAHVTSQKRHLKQKDHLLNVTDSSHKLYTLNWSCCGATLPPCGLWRVPH